MMMMQIRREKKNTAFAVPTQMQWKKSRIRTSNGQNVWTLLSHQV